MSCFLFSFVFKKGIVVLKGCSVLKGLNLPYLTTAKLLMASVVSDHSQASSTIMLSAQGQEANKDQDAVAIECTAIF